MTHTNRTPEGGEKLRYRMELEGELPREWAAWFGADSVTAADGATVIELDVTDQAALHGVLRRVHDLHLRLISLTRVNDR